MRSFTLVFLLAFATILSACTGTETPVFGEPVPLTVTHADNVAGPRLSVGPGGEVVLSWMNRGETGGTLRFATLQNGKFSPAADVVTDPKMFVNWADLPSVMHVADNHWLAHWLSYSADATYAYDILIAQSFDGAQSWSTPIRPHTDGTPTEHGFVSMMREDDGVALLWLDGRNTPAEAMTLRAAVMTPDGERNNEQLVDEAVCDCCQTDVAISTSGPVAVYRNRTAEEIRDIYISRYRDGHWQPGVPLFEDNWKIPGCPVNGPSIVASGDRVAVVWFSAAYDRPIVRVVTSDDGGVTFAAPVEIAAGRIMGFAGLAMLADGSLAVSWVGRNDAGSNTVNLRRVDLDGQTGPVRMIGETQQLRVFPQLARDGDDLVLVWTDEAGDARYLRAVKIPVSMKE